MSSGSPQYEFTRDQNTLLGSLAYKMRWVGLFMVMVGLLNMLTAALLVAAIYKSKVPADWVNKVPEEVQSQLNRPNDHLWGFAAGSAVSGLIYLLVGVWTRSASASFKQIVDTQGRDITWLMKALESLHSAYSLIYTLLVIGLILVLSAAAISLYTYYFG